MSEALPLVDVTVWRIRPLQEILPSMTSWSSKMIEKVRNQKVQTNIWITRQEILQWLGQLLRGCAGKLKEKNQSGLIWWTISIVSKHSMRWNNHLVMMVKCISNVLLLKCEWPTSTSYSFCGVIYFVSSIFISYCVVLGCIITLLIGNCVPQVWCHISWCSYSPPANTPVCGNLSQTQAHHSKWYHSDPK